MRMPRKLVPVSTIDPESGNISMRRLDPLINNFNEYLIAACRSNMDIKFIWTGSDAKALVYYVTDYVTKMNLSFHDTLSLVQKCIPSMDGSSSRTSHNLNAIEKSRKLVRRCYNSLASQQELSGVQVASYLMNWDDHYTTHKFQGLFLFQIERYLQTQLNEMRAKQSSPVSAEGKKFTGTDVRCFRSLFLTDVNDDDDDDIYDDETTNDAKKDEEQFQV